MKSKKIMEEIRSVSDISLKEMLYELQMKYASISINQAAGKNVKDNSFFKAMRKTIARVLAEIGNRGI